MSRERRIHPRTPTRIRTTVRRSGSEIEGVVENVGAGGVFFSTSDLETAVDVGEKVVIRLHVDDQRTRDLAATVLRAERYFDGAEVRRSFAMKFDAEIDVASLDLDA